MDRYEEALAKARAEYEKAREQGYTWLMNLLEGMFPDLKESEDERIRKHLIARLKPLAENDGLFDYLITKDKVLAWLEKQKYEYEVFEPIENTLEYKAGFKAGIESEKQKEQKPNYCHYGGDPNIERCKCCSVTCSGRLADEQKSAEWSDTDNIGWDEAFACVTRAEKAAKNEEELQNAVTAENWLKEIKCKYYVHPVKPEWSEEEKDKLNSIERLIVNANAHGNYLIGDKEATDLQHFIRSIVKPTTNLAEWSEEDKEMVRRAIFYTEQYRTNYGDTKESEECFNWLLDLHRNIRPPFHWKPSEEQMEWLKSAVILSADKPNIHGTIISLYEQLKRL